MATFKERNEQRLFIIQLETVSIDLAAWAQDKFDGDWSIDDVKMALRNAAKFCGRE